MKKKISIFVVISILFIFNEKLFTNNSMLEKRIGEIRNNSKENSWNLEKIEKEYLNLLNDFNSPEETGEIFYYLSQLYKYNKDYKENKRKYCESALKYPLETIKKLDIYLFLGNTYFLKPKFITIDTYYSFYIYEDEGIKSRKKAVKIWLEGLILLQEFDLPEERQNLPGVGLYHVITEDDTVLRKIEEKIEKQKQERERIKFENDLIFKRDALYEQCISIYSYKPYDNEEFYQLMLEGLGDEYLANELLARLEERISAQKERYKRRDEILELLKQQEEENK